MKGVLQQGCTGDDGVVQHGCSDSFREVSGAWLGGYYDGISFVLHARYLEGGDGPALGDNMIPLGARFAEYNDLSMHEPVLLRTGWGLLCCRCRGIDRGGISTWKQQQTKPTVQVALRKADDQFRPMAQVWSPKSFSSGSMAVR